MPPLRAFVSLRLPDGTLVELEPGDLIGRAWSAALTLDDPRISEAHALVSLRGRHLKLLALRGRFALEGKLREEIELAVGQVIELAAGLALTVEALGLPEHVLALEGPGLPRQVLAGVCSLVTEPLPRLLPGWHREAVAWIWGDPAWRILRPGEAPHTLQPGDVFTVHERTFKAVAVPLDLAGRAATHTDALQEPIEIIAHYESVHLRRQGRPVLTLAGISARLVSELVAFKGPVAWEVLAAELWPEEADRLGRRRRLDVALSRLRARLRAARVRPDLVRSNGSGQVELVLDTGDVVRDEL